MLFAAQYSPEREGSLLPQRPEFPRIGVEVTKIVSSGADDSKGLVLKIWRVVVVRAGRHAEKAPRKMLSSSNLGLVSRSAARESINGFAKNQWEPGSDTMRHGTRPSF